MIEGKATSRGYALVVQSLEHIPEAVVKAAGVGLARGLEKTVGVVKREYLMGPRPQRLGEVTGRLLGSITQQVATAATTVTGKIGTNVRYALFHEVGFHGIQQVRSFNRVLSLYTGIGVVIGGRDEKGRIKESGGKKAAKKQKSGAVGFETVKAHERHVDYAGRPFVAPALAKSLPLIIDDVKSEIALVKP